MPKKDFYISELKKTKDWKNYLLANSNLPGPRGNLELAQAFVEIGAEKDFLHFLEYTPELAPANSPEEFLSFCGTVGLGRLIAEGKHEYFPKLKELASDPRWRTREGVAWALQMVGKKDFILLISGITSWISGNCLEQRAVAAGLCEPVLLKKPEHVAKVLEILNIITLSINHITDRKDKNFRILRQGLGYCWSVAISGNPVPGKSIFEKLFEYNDPDINWIMRENLKKNRLIKMDQDWVKRILLKIPR